MRNPTTAFLSAILLVEIFSNIPAFARTNHYDHEKSLRTAVLTNYEYKIRPETKVTCNVRLSLLNINILDVPQQSLSVSGWLTVKWNDSRLTWDPSSYGNIADFYDTEHVLWRPEIIVDNSIASLGVIESDKLLIRVTRLGEMTWEPLRIFQTHCEVDVTFYPFDTQECAIEVTSWAYTANEVDLRATDADIYLEDFSLSGEWEVMETWNERKLLIDGDDIHSEIDFHIKLRRRPVYYVMTILIPAIVTSVLCVLVFILPTDSGEKVGYTLTILLTYALMLNLVASYMPPTSKISILSVYLTIILIVGVICTLLTVIGLYFHHHSNDRPMPPILHSIFRKIIIPLVRWKHRDGAPSDDKVRDVYLNSRMSTNRVHPNYDDDQMKENLKNQNDNKSISKENHNDEDTDDIIDNDMLQVTWQELAIILDAFFFRVMGLVVLVLTIMVIMTLLIGGYTA